MVYATNMNIEEFKAEWEGPSKTITVHTSGSTGKPKEMAVEKTRMMASAKTTCDFLQLQRGDTALLCMSLDYIAGKMMVVRAMERGLKLVCTKPTNHPLAKDYGPLDLVAMVPMQVKSTLKEPEEAKRLKSIKHLIIGGGAIDASLAQELSTFPHNVWSSYGMTETLSHIALRKLNGPEATELYTPMEGVSIRLTDKGTLAIRAEKIYPEEIVTNDLAEINAKGQFRILGRTDNTINSGGIKVQIEEAERMMRTAMPPELQDKFRISSRPHEMLGEEVVMLIEKETTDTERAIIEGSYDTLPNKYWHPRAVVEVAKLPLTPNGKPDRKASKEMAYQSKA